MRVIIASNNEGKIREFKQMLKPLGYEVISQSQAGINITVQETGKTFEENARLKGRAIHELTGEAVIADDSGLEVDCLGGAPGVDTANYDIDWLLEKMEGIPKQDRAARFVCNIYYADKHRLHKVQESCEGWIAFERKGSGGFGYDPIFMSGNRSFAEISDDEKNRISHRAKALRRLVEAISDKESL
jgi:XTP/dITP diphosphohydrolase